MLAGAVPLIAGVLAAIAPGDSAPALAVALVPLGLIIGTTLVTDGSPAAASSAG